MRTPDILVTMSPDAYKLFAAQLKPDGLLLYESDLVTPDNLLPAGARKIGIPSTRFAEEIGRRLVSNIVMVGFISGVTGVASPEAIEKAVRDSIPRGTEDLNLRAMKKGFEYGVEARKALP